MDTSIKTWTLGGGGGAAGADAFRHESVGHEDVMTQLEDRLCWLLDEAKIRLQLRRLSPTTQWEAWNPPPTHPQAFIPSNPPI